MQTNFYTPNKKEINWYLNNYELNLEKKIYIRNKNHKF